MGSNNRGDDASIAMLVSALATDPVTALPVVLLRDPVAGTTVAVSIGLSEASALAAEIDGIELSKPATHQLMAAMLEACGAEVKRVVVTDVEGGLFCAVVHLRLACGTLVVQDARPSDAIALALHTGAEIQVASHVIDQVAGFGMAARWDGLPAAEDELLSTLGDDVFGKWKM
jgi:bifunctional DNase/RNase